MCIAIKTPAVACTLLLMQLLWSRPARALQFNSPSFVR